MSAEKKTKVELIKECINTVINESQGKLSETDAEFIVNFCLDAFDGKFDNDRYIDENEPVKSFGFSELFSICSAYFEQSGKETNKEALCVTISNNIIARMRYDVELEDYIEQNLIEEDRKLYEWLTASKTIEIDPMEDVLGQFIYSNHEYNTLLDSSINDVASVYKYLFQDSFGLESYEGVVVLGNTFAVNGKKVRKPKEKTFKKVELEGSEQTNANSFDKLYELTELPFSNAVFSYIIKALSSKLQVNVSDSRQFDLDQILSSELPVYYPKKILEYMCGFEPTSETNLNVFKQHAASLSWDDVNKTPGYFNACVKPQIKKLFFDCIYRELNSIKSFDNSKILGNPKADVEILKLHQAWEKNSSAEKVRNALTKVKCSLCTAVVVPKYNTLANKVNAISVRLVEVNPNLKMDTSSVFTKKLFENIVSYNPNLVYNNGLVISDVAADNLAFRVIEYKHDFDAKVSNCEPLFGYKAVEMFKQRGKDINWDNILIGMDVKGTPQFCNMDDPDAFKMQECIVHNMMAGSRSGKGVMTMNILASAIAAHKPIFYIDRKPEMAEMFYRLTNGNMFIINGGQYEAKNDPKKLFDRDGEAIQGWQEHYNTMPEYLKSALFKENAYAGNFGDYVYYRAIMLLFSILIARVSCPQCLAQLGGLNGIVAVVDEFKNWQVKFESQVFITKGIFGNDNRITKENINTFKKAKMDIAIKQQVIEANANDPKKAASVMKDKAILEQKQKELEESITPFKLYATTVMDKYGKSIKTLGEKFGAAFQDGEGRRSDIFLIGQDIEFDGYFNPNSAPYPIVQNKTFKDDISTKDKSLMRGIFDHFPGVDWIMGFNKDTPETKKYMDAENDEESHEWITEKKYWGYVHTSTLEELRHKKPEGTKFFKPYLVLINHLEDDPLHPAGTKFKDPQTGKESFNPNPDYRYVSDCRKRCNDAVPNIWDTIRLKHLRHDVDVKAVAAALNEYESLDAAGRENFDRNRLCFNQLNEGIGFEGLVHTNNPDTDLATVLSASAEIANFVAQKMGYANYKELLFDFTPKGLFCIDDVLYAIDNGAEAYNSSEYLKVRYPLYDEYGFMGELNSVGSNDEDDDEEDYDDDYYENKLKSYNQAGGLSKTSVDTPLSQGNTVANHNIISNSQENNTVNRGIASVKQGISSSKQSNRINAGVTNGEILRRSRIYERREGESTNNSSINANGNPNRINAANTFSSPNRINVANTFGNTNVNNSIKATSATNSANTSNSEVNNNIASNGKYNVTFTQLSELVERAALEKHIDIGKKGELSKFIAYIMNKYDAKCNFIAG